ncbi:MAG: protein kinase, partial [Polyangiaceae bacterium]
TDDLIDALSMTPGLRVRSRGAIIHLKGNLGDPRELGRQLEVQVVVDGSLRRVGDNVRVSARLISVAEGFQLWAKRFECPSGDVLRVGDEAAAAIAEALTVKSAAMRIKPTDPIVVDLYLRARHEYHKSWIDPDNKAIALFAQAYERAPDDPMILSGYAMALLRRFGIEEGQDMLGDVARDMAERALAIAPEMAEAKLALARVRFNMGDPLTAMKMLGVALRESQGLAEAHDIVGRVLIEVARPAEGVAHLKKAAELDPLVSNFGGEYARMHALLGDWTTSDALLVDIPEEASRLNFYWLTRVRLAIWRRDKVYAAQLLEKILERPFTAQPIAASICHLIIQGEALPGVQRAILMGARASGRATRRRSFFCQVAAELAAYLGAEDEALSAMEDGVDAKLIDIFWLDRCPLFDDLRSHPRFLAVRKTVDARANEILACLGMT